MATDEKKSTRDAESWARHRGPLSVGDAPAGALNLNVEGRELAGPMQGFGRLWQKTYGVALTGVAAAPHDVIAAWKANYDEFWPEGNNFYAPLAGIEPGEVGLIDADMPGGMKLSTGVMVLYADDVSFTFMTPLGHPFAGWITFSAEDAQGTTHAQVEVLMRATDPASEVGLMLGGHRTEDRMWQQTLTNLATFFEVPDPEVDTQVVCVDRKRQWDRVGNIRQDAVLHTALHLASAPVRAIGMSWRGLLTTAAVTITLAQVVLMAIAGIVIPPLAVFAVLPLVGLGMLSRWERTGAGFLAVLGTFLVLGNIPFIVPALSHPESPVDFLHIAFTLVPSLAMVVAGVALLRGRSGSPRRLAIGGATVLTLMAVVSVVAALGTTSDTFDPTDVELVARDVTWQPTAPTAATGETLHVDNEDLFHHTFTIEELDIDVQLPASTARDVSLAGIEPGTYDFVCAVPGHEAMTGTIVVTE